MKLKQGVKRPTNLREWRLAQVPPLSQREAAKRLGISMSYLSLIESGQHYPRVPLAKRIAEQTGVALERLIGIAS